MSRPTRRRVIKWISRAAVLLAAAALPAGCGDDGRDGPTRSNGAGGRPATADGEVPHGLVDPGGQSGTGPAPGPNGQPPQRAGNLLDSLQPWFDRHERPSFKPVVRNAERKPGDSKFAGRPWLAPGELWPVCGACKRPMQLFVQLDLSSLPDKLEGTFGTGLLQVFRCTYEADSSPPCRAKRKRHQPFSEAVLARIVQPAGDGQKTEMPDVHTNFPCKTITGWTEQPDYPARAEFEEQGLVIDSTTGRLRANCRELDISVEIPSKREKGLERCNNGDKLAGWPFWIGKIEYPTCPRCGKRMDAVLFQIDSNHNLPFMFGDFGYGYVTQCPRHKDVVAFTSSGND